MAIRSKDISAIYEVTYNPNYVPRKSPDAHIEELEVEGKPTFVLMKESDHEYYQVDDDTNAVWRLLDGNRTVKEVVEEAKKADEAITEKDVKDIIISLAEEGTIESTEAEIEKKRVEVESAVQINLHLVKDSSKSLAGLFRVTKKLMRKWNLPVAIAISVAGAVLFAGTFLHILSTPSTLQVGGSTLLGFLFYEMFILLPVYAIHELAHGAVCDYYGGNPREIGTGLYYLSPFFYCDTSDSWRLPKRARIIISVAGPLSTVVIAAFFVFISFFVSGFPKTILQVGAFFGFYGTVINFSPIVETDGYYIISDILNMPNLRDEAFSFLRKGLLRAVGAKVSRPRLNSRTKVIFSLYAAVMVGWLAFFAYWTVGLFSIYGAEAYSALASLGFTALGTQAFSIVTIGVNLVTIVYFGLLVGGFAVMGKVAYGRIHIGKARLETIHDKRVSVFMPVPSFILRKEASKLVKGARGLSGGFSRSFAVTLEPPFCVAALKLGKVDETLDTTRANMSRVELSFRELHSGFLSHRRDSDGPSGGKKLLGDTLLELARQVKGRERGRAISGASDFLARREQALRTLLLSAFGSVWTLELSPDDFRRLRKQIFPALVAGDLGGDTVPPAVEDFKKRVVFGPDALARLSSAIEEESSEVFRNPETYQTAAFLEPMGSKLVFAGRTDRVQGSVVWLGGLFLYQAWVGFISEALDDASVGLRSAKALPSPVTKAQAAKLKAKELGLLKSDFARLEAVDRAVQEATTKIESTYQSAVNFHDGLNSMVTDGGFDVGLYTPILNANQTRLEGVRERLAAFTKEWTRAYERAHKARTAVEEESAGRVTEPSPSERGWVERLSSAAAGLRSGAVSTPTFEAEVRSIYSTVRLVHDVVAASDLVL